MKTFRVLETSLNCNSFGLRGVILVAKDGEAWEIGTNDINCPQRGRDYSMPESPIFRRQDFEHFAVSQGWEISRRLPKAPQEIIDAAWTWRPHNA